MAPLACRTLGLTRTGDCQWERAARDFGSGRRIHAAQGPAKSSAVARTSGLHCDFHAPGLHSKSHFKVLSPTLQGTPRGYPPRWDPQGPTLPPHLGPSVMDPDWQLAS